MDAWTILIYMCGSDLESDEYLATADIEEILSVSNQPDDINIVIETGGAKKWSSTYSISNDKLSRYYVSNKKLNLIDKLSNASMGATSTFQNFLEWGLKTYPADKTGVIMWNHGGGMEGVCYDEYQKDYLTNAELQSALKTTFTNLNRSEKLEWIGYDACLMQVQDIAETNSQYFNYMVAAQESEAGEGWDYDNWIDDLYAYKDTKTILSEICDTFIADYERNYGSKYSNDQTLSVLDLSKMSAYKTSFEKMAKRLYSNYSSIYSTLKTIASSSKNYGEYVDGHTTYKYDFALFDAKDMLSKMKTNSYFKSDSELIGYINECISQISDIVIHNTIGDDAGNSNGISLFFNYEYYEYPYTANDTNFYYWRLINGF